MQISLDRQKTLKAIQDRTGIYDQLNDAFSTRLFGVPLSHWLHLRMEVDPGKIESLINHESVTLDQLKEIGITVEEETS